MNTVSRRKYLIIVAVIVILLACFAGPQTRTEAKTNSVLAMEPPPFLSAAQPQDSAGSSALGDLLDSEAGISAYYKAPDAITLSQVRGQFRTIETENTDYILGSVAVPNHSEHYDAHVYVNKNGWILAYYMRSDPVSIMADIYNTNVNNTKLKSVVSIIAGAAGAPFTDVTYYDFRYPNATNILFVAEDYADGNQFTINIPSTYGYFERGWAANNFGYGGFYFRLDGVDLPNLWNQNNMMYGTITASQLLPDTTHTIIVDDAAILIIVYRVP